MAFGTDIHMEKADAGSEPSYPCIVLKIRETEKPIEFLGFIIK